MSTWSGMRNKLETKYLAESLRGRIRYFATTYRESHDQIGRAAILLDGQEILKGNFFNYAFKNQLIANKSMQHESLFPVTLCKTDVGIHQYIPYHHISDAH